LQPFRRDFYTNVEKFTLNKDEAGETQPKSNESSSEDEAEAANNTSGAGTQQRKVPKAAKDFADARLPRYLLESLAAEGLTKPTPIQ